MKSLSDRPPRRQHVTGQSGSHPHTDRNLDFYETPSVATDALLRVEWLPRPPAFIWEPAAGNGAIAKVLEANGYRVVKSDIVQRDYELDCVSDFLTMPAQFNVEAIVSNPPYRLAHQFVIKALRLVPEVHFLLRLTFLESMRRSDILDTGNLRAVRVFKNRLPFMHRDGWAGPRATSSIAFAWFSFSRDHNGPAELSRIEWFAP